MRDPDPQASSEASATCLTLRNYRRRNNVSCKAVELLE